jgi:hypothetical protein
VLAEEPGPPAGRRVEHLVLGQDVGPRPTEREALSGPATHLCVSAQDERLPDQSRGSGRGGEGQRARHLRPLADDERLPGVAELGVLGQFEMRGPGRGPSPAGVGHGAGDVAQLEPRSRSDVHLELYLVTTEQERGGGHQSDAARFRRPVHALRSQQSTGGAEAGAAAADRDFDPGGHHAGS